MKTDSRQVLVVGATGTVGSEVVRATVAAGGNVRALVRSAGSAAKLPPGVEAVSGDLREHGALARALRGVDAMFYVAPHEPDEESLADVVIRACTEARVRLVFVGVHVDAPTRFGRAIRRFMFGRMLAHYRPKFRLSERVRMSQTDPVVLMPTNFFQNDEVFRTDIEEGTFRQPFERAVNRVDVRDVGDAAARALLDPALPSGAYPVVGSVSLTGVECAAIWSAALGRPVRYDGDESSFRAAVGRVAQGKKHDDFVASYGAIRKFEIPTVTSEVERTTALLGRAPTSYEAYVRRTAEEWRRSRAGRISRADRPSTELSEATPA